MTPLQPTQREPPPFESLPLDPSGPPGNAWGRFGADDQLGMLNLLTPEVVAEAAKEIRTGVRISLDWHLNKPSMPSFSRQPLEHRIVNRDPARAVNDDVLTFNTQGSSQWDGFRHYGYLPSSVFYNGTTEQEILAGSSKIGIDAIADAGGIVGRGVLIDFARWADRHGRVLPPFETSVISLDEVKAAADAQGLVLRHGDILFLRSGFTRAYNALKPDEQAALPRRPSPNFAGVESTEAMIRWLWQHQFAAVAGDAVAFEACPPGSPQADPNYILHQWLLPRWGMPIGEMFDLERLSEECSKQQRYSFFVSSVPLKVPGGVASPPNAVAIF